MAQNDAIWQTRCDEKVKDVRDKEMDKYYYIRAEKGPSRNRSIEVYRFQMLLQLFFLLQSS
jgi:hypothetical protein